MKAAASRTVLFSAVLMTFVGVVGVGAAHAVSTLTVSATTPGADNIYVDGEPVSVTVGGYSIETAKQPHARVEIAQCGNAYGNGDPLPASELPSVIQGELDITNCEVIGYRNPGVAPGGVPATGPFTIEGPYTPPEARTVTVRQHAIGTGNRTCIAPDEELDIPPCFIYISTSVNMPTDFPTIPIAFEGEPVTTEPAVTTTTVAPVGSPISLGKVGHARVQVTTSDPTLAVEGTVKLFNSEDVEIGSGPLVHDATEDVHDATADITLSPTISPLTLGDHEFTAEFLGNGSFAPSSSDPATMTVIPANNITIGDASIVEGDTTATRSLVFAVVRPTAAGAPTVDYTVVGSGVNQATVTNLNTVAESDVLTPTKTSATKTLKFASATVRYIVVKIVGDTRAEPDETFSVVLSNPTGGYVLRDGTGTGTIYDDEDAPAGSAASIAPVEVAEGDTGSAKAMKFAVSLSNPIATSVTVFITVSSPVAEDNLPAGYAPGINGSKTTGDWGGAVTKKVVLRPNFVNKYLVVPAFSDTNSEQNLRVKATITSVTGGPSIGSDSVAYGTIRSDE